MTKTRIHWLVLSASTLGLGLSMPACPGQQAMQQQLDNLEKRETAVATRIQGIDTQVKAATAEVAKMGPALQNLQVINQALIEQKSLITDLQKQVAELSDKVKSMGSKPAPAPKAKGKK